MSIVRGCKPTNTTWGPGALYPPIIKAGQWRIPYQHPHVVWALPSLPRLIHRCDTTWINYQLPHGITWYNPMWRFPKLGVPPNHPCEIFQEMNHPAIKGYPHLWYNRIIPMYYQVVYLVPRTTHHLPMWVNFLGTESSQDFGFVRAKDCEQVGYGYKSLVTWEPAWGFNKISSENHVGSLTTTGVVTDQMGKPGDVWQRQSRVS